MPYSAPTRTVSDVMTTVKRAFGDESGVQLQDSDIIMWINDAQDEINRQNRIFKTTATKTTTPGTAIYAVDAITPAILQISSIHYGGQRLPNIPFAQGEQLGLDNSASATPSSGEPYGWYEWGGSLTFYPTPATAQTFTIYYTAVPTKVALAADKLAVPDKYYSAICQYVLQQAYEMDEDWQASQTKGQQFTDGLNTLADEERTAQTMTYGIIGLVD